MKMALTSRNMVQLTAETAEESMQLYQLMAPKKKEKKKKSKSVRLAKESPELISSVMEDLREGRSIYNTSKRNNMSTYKVEKLKRQLLHV